MLRISIGYNCVLFVSGAIWMDDFGDDYEDFFNEVLNALKGMSDREDYRWRQGQWRKMDRCWQHVQELAGDHCSFTCMNTFYNFIG